MNTSSDIWFAFARTFTVLLLVLAVLILVFYFIRKFSNASGMRGGKDLIRVLSVHHLSPKEKLVLLTVLDETLLIGVTPSNISRISSFEGDIDLPDVGNEQSSPFSQFLAKKLGGTFQDKRAMEKGERK